MQARLNVAPLNDTVLLRTAPMRSPSACSLRGSQHVKRRSDNASAAVDARRRRRTPEQTEPLSMDYIIGQKKAGQAPAAARPVTAGAMPSHASGPIPAGPPQPDDPDGMIMDGDSAHVHAGRHRGVAHYAGAGRFLGNLVRPLQNPHACAGEGDSPPPAAGSGWSRSISTRTSHWWRNSPSSACRSSPYPPWLRSGRARSLIIFQGALPESDIKRFVEALLKIAGGSMPSADLLAEARCGP